MKRGGEMIDKQIRNILPIQMRKIIETYKDEFKHLQEIRMRINRVPILLNNGEECKIEKLSQYIVDKRDIRETLEYISQYSLYAYEQELSQGYITIQGGHRIGVAGKGIIEGGQIKNLKYISSLNIRIAHEVMGCANSIIPYIAVQGKLCHTLIISPPRCGKTTILRDIIRMASDGNAWLKGGNVGVVDERSEIGGCYQGVPQNDLGKRTDILDACPKVEGMMMLVRSMSPEVIAIDEIGKREEVECLEYMIHCGCTILGTVHGATVEEIRNKPALGGLVEKKVFQRYVVLTNKPCVGSVGGVYDGDGVLLYQDAG